MSVRLLLILLLTSIVSSFDCELYLNEYKPDDPTLLPLEDRSAYAGRLCDTLRVCHANPLLDSFEMYVRDIENCYGDRGFIYNQSAVDRHSIESYIDVLHALSAAQLRYDTESLLCKDDMSSIVDSVRLRSGYLREFQYSRAPHVSGDVLLLLKSERAMFESNVGHQINDLSRMSSVVSLQLSHITSLLGSLQGVRNLISELETNLTLSRVIFAESVEKIQQNVVSSFIELSN